MAKYKKRIGKPVLLGKSLERCVRCGELEYCNHMKCGFCNQMLCYKYAFGMRLQDCYDGIIERRHRVTKEIVTLYIKEWVHWCPERVWEAKYNAVKLESLSI